MQLNSLTAFRESAKLFYSIAANKYFYLRLIDILAVFLQSKELNREVIVELPSEIKKEGIVWRLVKPIYRLNNAIGTFWLKMKELLKKDGLISVRGDEAFYF